MPTPRPERIEEIENMIATGHASLPWEEEDAPAATPHYEDYAEGFRQASVYFRSLRALHGSKKAAIMILAFFGYSAEEIAKILKLSPDTIRVYLCTMRQP